MKTNPRLKDAVRRNELEKLVRRSVRSSCGVEGIEPKAPETRLIEIKHRTVKKIYKPAK